MSHNNGAPPPYYNYPPYYQPPHGYIPPNGQPAYNTPPGQPGYIPPQGQPGYNTPGQSAPGYAYVPAPVLMPMPIYPPLPQDPPSQPTFVTNHIYQPPAVQPTPEPVKFVEGPITTALKGVVSLIQDVKEAALHKYTIDWVPATLSSISTLTHRAFVAGKEGWDGSPLWVIRSNHSGEQVPGKLAAKHGAAYIPYSGKEIPVHFYDVLCASPNALRWVPSSHGQVPPGALQAGRSHSGEPLYVGRAKHLRSTTPGKIHPSHGCCYISFGGSEIPFKNNYEILCRN